jgi:hypothetical protein
MASFRLNDFKPVVKNTLRGFASGRLDFGDGIAFDIAEVAVHQRDGREWAGWPARPLIDRDGQALRDENGKPRYSAPLVRPADRALADRLAAAIIAAVRRAHPEALGEREAANG